MLRAIVGRLQDALADCDEALKQQPGDAFALDGRAFANLKLGNLDAAISGFDAALKANPNLAIAFYGRGLAKRKKGDTAGANSDIASAKSIWPAVVGEFAHWGAE